MRIGTASLRWQLLFVLVLPVVNAGCAGAKNSGEEVKWGQPKPPSTRGASSANAGAEPDSPKSAGGTRDGKQQEVASSGGDVAAEDSAAGVTGPTSDAPGEAAGDGPGEGTDTPRSEAFRPPPALPGREPNKPARSAVEAAESAKRLLKRAQQMMRKKDASGAAEAAIEAYDQVFPHATSDAECEKLCRQLEVLLSTAGRMQGPADAVPTRFE